MISGRQICRMCAKCNQATRAVAETHCPRHGGKQYERKTCQECDNKAIKSNGTLCASCWVKKDSEARGCPGCRKEPKVQSRADGWCATCVRNAAVATKRDTSVVFELHRIDLDYIVDKLRHDCATGPSR